METPLDVPLSELIALADLPTNWPVAAGGRRLHKHTGFRYVNPGVAGIRLRAIRVPGCGLMTHPRWIAEFVAALNASRHTPGKRGSVVPAPRRSAPVSDSRNKTSETLARMGLPDGNAAGE